MFCSNSRNVCQLPHLFAVVLERLLFFFAALLLLYEVDDFPCKGNLRAKIILRLDKDLTIELLYEVLTLVKSNFDLLVLRENFRGLEFSEIVKQAGDPFSLYADPCILHIYDQFFARFIQFARDGNLTSIRKSESISRQMYYGLLQPSHIGHDRVWQVFLKNSLDVYLFFFALEFEHLDDVVDELFEAKSILRKL